MKASRPNRRYQLALWIDRWVGPVLCAALLCVKRLVGRRRDLTPAEDVHRILVLKMWGMGSIVLATPLLAALRRRYPAARIDFVTLSENTAALELIADVDRVISLNLSRGIPGFLASTLPAIVRIRRERYQLLFDLEFFTRFSAIFSFLARPLRSHGFSAKGQWRGRLHDVEVPFNSYNHVAVNFQTLLRGDPTEPVESEAVDATTLPLLTPSDEAARRCDAILREHPAWQTGEQLIVVNPNAGDMSLERRWPLERMAEFLTHLCGRTRANIALTGSPAEREYVESVVAASRMDARILNLAGRMGIPELVALLARADVVVTNDSGPLHLAAAAGASIVALFGPETPTLYGPLRARHDQRHVVHYRRLACSPCMFVHDNKVLSCWFAQAKCMTGILPADVLASVDNLLAGATDERRATGPLRLVDP